MRRPDRQKQMIEWAKENASRRIAHARNVARRAGLPIPTDSDDDTMQETTTEETTDGD